MGQQQGKPRQGCMGRLLSSCGERSLINRFMGRNDDTPVDHETQMRYKQLSFYDFDEDKSNLMSEETKGGLDFSDDESVQSDFQSVDEGSIAILSMDEIRNMKTLEKDYYKQKEQLSNSQAFVKPPPELDWENINKDDIECLDMELGQNSQAEQIINIPPQIIEASQTPETPRPSAWGLEDLQKQIGEPINEGGLQSLTSKLNDFIQAEEKELLKQESFQTAQGDISSHSIDNGDIGSTKDYDNKSEQDFGQGIMTPKTKIDQSQYSSALINVNEDDKLSMVSVEMA